MDEEEVKRRINMSPMQYMRHLFGEDAEKINAQFNAVLLEAYKKKNNPLANSGGQGNDT